jgi:hypothetical protein
MSRAEWERAYNKLCVEERKPKITQAVAYIQQYLRTDLNKNILDIKSCGDATASRHVNVSNVQSRTEVRGTTLGLGKGVIIIQSKKSSVV